MKIYRPHRMHHLGLQISHTRYTLLCVLMSAAIALTLIAASTHGIKWMAAVFIGMVAFFSCFILISHLKSVSLILAVFLIPLRVDFYLIHKATYYPQTSYPGLPITAFDIILFALVFYWVLQILKGEDKFNFYPKLSIPALLYVVLSGVSVAYAADRELSLALFALIVKSYVVFLYFANRIKTPEDMNLVILGLILTVLLQSVFGSIQYFGGGVFHNVFGIPPESFRTDMHAEYVLSRVGGTIGHPNALGSFLNFCLPAFLVCCVTRCTNRNSILPWLGMIAGGAVLLMTASRANWAALALASLFLFYNIFRYYFFSRLKSFIGTILLVCFLCGAILAISSDVRIRLLEAERNRSAESRIPMAAVALNVIRHNFFSGVGLNNYAVAMNRFDRTREWETYLYPRPVHNGYLLIAAESGIFTLVAFLWFIAATITRGLSYAKLSKSTHSLMPVPWITSLLTWLITAIVYRHFAGSETMIWFACAMIAAIGHWKPAVSPLEKEYSN